MELNWINQTKLVIFNHKTWRNQPPCGDLLVMGKARDQP